MPPAPPPAAPGDGPSRLAFGQIPWLEVAGLAALLAAIVVPLVFLGGPSPPPAGPPPGTAGTLGVARVSFQFGSAPVTISALGSVQAIAASHEAAETIRASLSRFYDQAFADPSTWTGGVPSSAWDLFSPSVRSQAQRDAASLALGRQVSGLAHLFVTQNSLFVRVLVDPRGRIEVSAADVRFAASGELGDGRFVDILDRASFLFRPESGRWMIAGYPTASLTLVPVQPAPTPSAASPSPSASGGAP